MVVAFPTTTARWSQRMTASSFSGGDSSMETGLRMSDYHTEHTHGTSLEEEESSRLCPISESQEEADDYDQNHHAN